MVALVFNIDTILKWEDGRKGSSALAHYLIWGGKSTHVNLEKPAEECAWVASWSLNVKCWNVGGM